MADKEQKLGPNVTYLGNGEDDKEAVEAHGIRFKPGEAVNVSDRLGESKSQETLKALAGNRFFKVDGGPDHQAEAKKKAEAEQKADEAEKKDREEADKEREEKAKGDRDKQGYVPPETEQLEKKGSSKPLRERG